MGKTVILCVSNDFASDRRVDKECLSLQAMGWQVRVWGRRLRAKEQYPQFAYPVKRQRHWFNKGPLFYAELNLRLFIYLLGRSIDVIHANDLDTLLACYLASKIKRKPLVYDSHEFFTEVPELLLRPFARRVWLGIESWIFPKLKHCFTVNDSIAQKYEERYGTKPLVVRNISPRQNPVTQAGASPYPANKFICLIQGAAINIDRGAEELILAQQYLSDEVLLVMIGQGDVWAKCQELVKRKQLENQVWMLNTLPYHELRPYTQHAHVGLSVDKATNPNYLYSLPNKLFDYLRNGLPILCSPVIEVARIVKEHRCGLVLNAVEPLEIADKIKLLLNNRALYTSLKEAAIAAGKCYSWEDEFTAMAKVYREIEDGI